MVGIERRERVLPRLIEEEMRESFLDYSMSVIVQRALPDVRDGLKPVHRRILYAMSELNLNPARPYKKSAAVVGEVLGKYHPHGDAAVYETLVRMVQDFSLRYPLVDGQGNFGSIDGDNAAAYRYTEARLAPVALELLADIDKSTVEWTQTFDGQREEPEVLPTRLPNLLVNGSSGIAVGMSTNVPPHNLREVAAALRMVVERPETTLDELMEVLPGPDFPTGGLIIGSDGIRDAYETGRGRIVMRARVHKEVKRDGKEQLVVTEVPYGVSKSRIVEQIAELVRTRKIDTISDLRDESDRDGIRVAIELKRGAKAQKVLEFLCRKTYLQATFGAIMLALDRGQPREFPLKDMLEAFREHRLEVIRRRATHDLEEARREAHIAEGLIVALDNIDEVIAIIRAARDRDDAAAQLRARFELSEAQADAILNMRLARLTSLEQDELKRRLEALHARIAELEALLGSEARQRELLLTELDEVLAKFGDARRTTIAGDKSEKKIQEVAAQEDWVIALSHEGFIKRIPVQLYRKRLERGAGVSGMDRYEQDYLERVFLAGTNETLFTLTDTGRAYALAVLDVPEAGPSSRGRALDQLLGLSDDEAVAALFSVAEFTADRYVLFVTRDGSVKRTPLDQFANTRAGGIAAMGVKDDDRLMEARLTDGTRDVLLVSADARAIRFAEEDVPAMGRTAQGVRGIKLREGDRVVGALVVRREATLCTVSELGHAHRSALAEYALQNRGGLGSAAMKLTDRTGRVIGACELLDRDDLMLVTSQGRALRVAAADIPGPGGKRAKAVVKLEAGETVAEATRVARVSGPSDEQPEADVVEAGEQLELIGGEG